MEQYDWFVEGKQTFVAFDWLSKRSGEKTSHAGELSRNQSILRFDVRLQTNDQSNNAFPILGFSLAGKRRVHVLIFSSIG